MPKQPERKTSFADFVANAPSLEDAARDDSVELTGLVSRTSDGNFAITTHAGQTYELPIEAVRDFTPHDEAGAAAATVRVDREAIAAASLRPIKPLSKDIITDPIVDRIKQIIHDGKNLITDPLVDKNPHADTIPFKDVHKDPLHDPVTIVQEQAGKIAGDPIGDPTQGGVNPAAAAAAPFVMATPHQAPMHLLQLQGLAAPGQQATTGAADLAMTINGEHPTTALALDVYSKKEVTADTAKEVTWDTLKEPPLDTHKEAVADTHKEPPFDTQKELVADTHKEPPFDTLKELAADTWVEQTGGYTVQEGVGHPNFGPPGIGPLI